MIAPAKSFTVTHSCGHERTLEARPREARQTQKWMATIQCPMCQDKAQKQAEKAAEKAAQDLAVTQMIQMGIHRISDTVFSVPSQTEEPNHIVVCGGFLSTPEYCSCKWFKNGGWSKKLCKHAEAVHLFIQEEVQTVDQKVYDDLVA